MSLIDSVETWKLESSRTTSSLRSTSSPSCRLQQWRIQKTGCVESCKAKMSSETHSCNTELTAITPHSRNVEDYFFFCLTGLNNGHFYCFTQNMYIEDNVCYKYIYDAYTNSLTDYKMVVFNRSPLILDTILIMRLRHICIK